MVDEQEKNAPHLIGPWAVLAARNLEPRTLMANGTENLDGQPPQCRAFAPVSSPSPTNDKAARYQQHHALPDEPSRDMAHLFCHGQDQERIPRTWRQYE